MSAIRPRSTAALRATVAALAAFASATPVLAQDMFEPNDICTDAAFVPLGQLTGLTLGPDDDYFLVNVPGNADITVDARDMSSNSLDVILYEVGCGAMLSSVTGATLEYFDCGGPARQMVIHVPANGAMNLDYTLDISAVEVVDDSFEDNDSCASGSLVAIQSFTTLGIQVTGCDEDYFIARLQRSGVQIQVDVLFDHDEGDIDVELLEFSAGACTGNVLASSTSTDDNESVTYTNTSSPSMAQAVVVRVFMKNGTGHNEYALSACFGDRTIDALIGTQQCAGAANSTGRPATLCALGSDFVADNNVKLYCVDLPAGSAGYFITAPDSDFAANPGGSQGNLCLGTPGRYSTSVLFTGSGSVFFQPNLNSIPVAGGGNTALVPGDRQLWQFWHRDFVGGSATSNFSSAIDITFQ